ncbi:MAG: hypothetical protein OSA43_11650, partial [Pirellulales bacterium]|nr:hypothetical protein [Pirellulales bacterium]
MSIAPSTSGSTLEPKVPVGPHDKAAGGTDQEGHPEFSQGPYRSDEISQPADFLNRTVMFTAIIAPFLGFV